MQFLADKTLGFFFNKGAASLFSVITEKYGEKQLREIIQDWSDRYFKDHFEQISMSEEFDFDGLNDYLRQNFYERVCVCFNAETSAERRVFTEQLYRQAYEYAKADTRPRKTAVRLYVENILAILKEYYLDKIDGKDLLLANHSVDDAVEAVRKISEEQRLSLEKYIAYHGSFAEFIDGITPRQKSKTVYHYLNPDILFRGRLKEIGYLDAFLAAPEPLLFTAVTGPGGIGKSKLMLHYMLRMEGDLDWKAVFPSRPQFENMVHNNREWRYPKNLLVALDYAGEMAESVGNWLALLSGTSARPPKTRVILLERQGIEKDKYGSWVEPLWYQNLIKINKESILPLLYPTGFHKMQPLEEDGVYELIDNIVAINGKQLPGPTKNAICERAVRFGHSEEDRRFNTPLIVILLTDAALDNGDNLRLSPDKLMEYVIGKMRRSWTETVCGHDDALFRRLERLMAYATATGGWDLKPIAAPLERDSVAFLGKYGNSELKSVLTALDEFSDSAGELRMMKPIEPDIVGEFYVLRYLKEHTYAADYRALVGLLWEKEDEFSSFLFRCAESFLGEPQFGELVCGECSIFNPDFAPPVSVGPLGYLSVVQELAHMEKTVKLLAKYTQKYTDPFVTLIYAVGLFNLTAKQDAAGRAATVEILRNIAEDTRYSDDQEIVLQYANGLFNLTVEQDAADTSATVERLRNIAEDTRYSDNQEIVLRYVKGLFNLTVKQNAAGSAATVERLRNIAEDTRYSDNQEIVLQYANGLFNLTVKQDAADIAATVERLCKIAEDTRYSDNQKIVLAYANGLVNLSVEQDAAGRAATVEILRNIAEDTRYSDNQQIVLAYAKGLVNLTVKQDAAVRAETVERLRNIAEDTRYSDDQEIVLRYAKGLINLANKQDAAGRAATVEKLRNIAEDTQYSDNQEIVLEYAKGLFNLSNKQDAAGTAATVERLRNIAEDTRYSDNQKIVLRYAKGLISLANKQDAAGRAATVEKLRNIAEDTRYPDIRETVLEYVIILENL